MKLQIRKSGIWYGSFKFGFWEYFAITLIAIIWTMVIFLHVRL